MPRDAELLPRTEPERRCAGLRRGDHVLLGAPHEPPAFWNAAKLLARERDTLFVDMLDPDLAGDPRAVHVERVRAFGTSTFVVGVRRRAEGATIDSRRTARELDELARAVRARAEELIEAVNAEALALCEARAARRRPS